MKSKTAKRGRRKPADPQRIARRAVEAIAAEQDERASTTLAEWVDEVTQAAGVVVADFGSRFFLPAFFAGVRLLGRTDERYKRVRDTVARVDAGETLAEIIAEHDRAKEEHYAKLEAERDRAPEPKNKLSPAWRHWKIRQINNAFALKGRRGDGKEYRKDYAEAWEYFKKLLTDLYYTPDFWHVDHARPLLPHLIESWQDLEGRGLMARPSTVRGTAARKPKARKGAAGK